MSESGGSAPSHFHIRWSSDALDHEPFTSSEQAHESAQSLVGRGESYSVEEFGDSCELCATLLDKVMKRLASSKKDGQNPKSSG
jgi:hypothetical protein